MRMIRVWVTLVVLAQSVAAAQTERFSFAGLSLNTTMADLQTRYPRSTALDTVVYVSTEETHDHISTIGLSSNGAARTLSIAFEREQRGGRATYPSCEKLLGVRGLHRARLQQGRPGQRIRASLDVRKIPRFAGLS